jgi:lactoylglutathione lyase
MRTGITARSGSRQPPPSARKRFVLAVPTQNLDDTYDLWRREGLPVTLEPQDAFWARIFYGLDPDGYELMFEQHHQVASS